MIITLVKADFSAKNIGTLSSFAILTNILNATYNGPTSISKGESFTATITMHDGYAIPDTGIGITMGGIVLNNVYTVNGNVITISIAEVTGVVIINMAGAIMEDTIITTLPLVQGYIDNTVINSIQANRVRSNDLISGPFSIELNNGYLIRALYEYDSTDVALGGTALVVSTDNATSYTGGTVGKYYGITLCKSVASTSLAPTEDIVKSFEAKSIVEFGASGVEDDTVTGTDVVYTLRNGAWVNSGLGTGYQNRVCTTEKIKGKFTVTTNDGYVIRAIHQYADGASDSGNSTVIADTSTTRTTYTTVNDSAYYGVTFTYAGESANNNIAPTEDIVAEWKYV